MAHNKTLKDLYKKHHRSFIKNLRSSENHDEEIIHELRVDIKKLRSLFKFLEVLSKQEFDRAKVMHLISPLFKSAGKIRAATLNIKLTAPYKIRATAGFKDHLKRAENSAKEDFAKKLKEFDSKKFDTLHKEIKKAFKVAPKKSIRERSDEYIKDRFLKIRKDMSDISSDDNFHDIRKKLKDVKTITGLLKDIDPRPEADMKEKEIETMEESIGKWNDTVTLADELEKYIFQNTNSDEHGTDKKNENDETLSLLVLNLRLDNELDKKLIAQQLKQKLF